MCALSILSDATVKADRDLLNFNRYITPLIYILTNPQTETPFTVGIFGAWGSGKSTLLSILDEQLQISHPDEFVRIHFNPWIHRGEQNMLVPLLHTLHDTLAEDSKNRFVESSKKIANVLVRLGADALIKSFTANISSLEALEKLEQNYLQGRGRVESEMRRLRSTLQAEADVIAAKNARLIFFIDDLDRCDPAQIIDLLESIKLFLDLRHVFVILAVDKEVIDRGIEVKYSKFQFGENRQAALGAEYLEKMVQLPLQLFPLDKGQVEAFIERLKPEEPILSQVKLLVSLIHPNPRKIKRIINILTVINDITDSSPNLKTLKRDLIAQLVIMQVQSADLYAAAVRQPELFFALERVFDGDLRPNSIEDYKDFGDRREAIQKLVLKFYMPESYLKTIFFKKKPFSSIKDDLQTYLSMIGG
jgi:hypothetical protein